MKNLRPYGTWPSPITAAMVAGKSPRISDVQIHDGRIFWIQSIAEEKGRSAIMMHKGGQLQCVLPRPLSAKSRVHEYGGGAYTVSGRWVYFVLAEDQRIYRGDYSAEKFEPQALSPADEGVRFADLVVSEQHQCIFAVRETHRGEHHSEVYNQLVCLALATERSVEVIAEGYDFYSSPCLSPCGKYLAWLCWHHPNMPWDATELWLADITDGGVQNPRHIAGNGNESLFQPTWSPNSELYVVSDRDNWWQIYRVSGLQQQPTLHPITQMQAEFAAPQWVFGMSTFGFLNADTLLACFSQEGIWRLGLIDLSQEDRDENRRDRNNDRHDRNRNNDSHTLTLIDSPLTSIAYLCCAQGKAAFVAGAPDTELAVYGFNEHGIAPVSETIEHVSPAEYAVPETITFPSSRGEFAHALFYPPTNTGTECTDELPPLIVICHGGPTGASEGLLNLKIQFWSNRGFAVADVNYRGSSGYGRDYRQSLRDSWGVVDVDDVCAVVDYLAAENRIDRNRCIIKGSSAGGYTVLAALAFRRTFHAGVSMYGIGNLETLVQDTHKFEARYLDKLVGPYPEHKAVYRARSPIHFVDNIQCPVLVFQGLLDKVVPPNQAEEMVNAVDKKGLPVAYITYANEAHGFRDPENIQHMLEAEWQFYAQLFKLPLEIPFSSKLHIRNL